MNIMRYVIEPRRCGAAEILTLPLWRGGRAMGGREAISSGRLAGLLIDTGAVLHLVLVVLHTRHEDVLRTVDAIACTGAE